eukprot:SAG11_NODE_747_length_7366_cov_7.215632_9_plen_358_part_00
MAFFADFEKITRGDPWFFVWFFGGVSQKDPIPLYWEGNCSNFFKFHRKLIADEKAKGNMSAEEGSPSMPFDVYKWLAEHSLETCNSFSNLFMNLEWNLISRGETTSSVNFKDMSVLEDAQRLTFSFHRFKAQLEGTDAEKDKKHCYSNPLPGNESIDLLLSLAIYLSEYDERYGHMESGKLFPTADPQSTFSKWLSKALVHPDCTKIMKVHGLNNENMAKKLTAHGIRKASASKNGQCVAGPSMMAVCLRAQWTIGAVLSRYFRFEASGDRFVGRCCARLDPCNAEFDVLPPHFKPDISDDYGHKIEGAMRTLFPTHFLKFRKRWARTFKYRMIISKILEHTVVSKSIICYIQVFLK